MNEITITPEMSWPEYNACQDALLYGNRTGIVMWALSAIGAASLAASAALTFGTPASLLAGLALAIFIFNLYFNGQINARRRRRAYGRYRESSARYTFTSDGIFATSRFGQAHFGWAGVDRVREMRALYLLDVGNSYVCVPKRNIPAVSADAFTQLLRTHGLQRQA